MNTFHHKRQQRNWLDYNQHNATDGQYLAYFDTNVVPNRSIVKNPSIIQRIPKKEKKVKQTNLNAPEQMVVKPVKPIPISKGKPQPASDTTVPDDIMVRARMVQASKLFDEKGITDAQNYLDRYKIDYTIDSQLSSNIGIVLIDNQTGETMIAYRGTDITNPKDLITDALALFGKEKSSPEYGETKQQLEAVEEAYGLPKELVGFSRGSVLSMNLGDEYGIPTTELNPLISPSLVKNQSKGTFHDIFRTKNDPVSFLAKGTLKDSNWRVRSILPLKDTLNGWEEHTLSQFLTNDTPRRTSIEELLNNRIVEQGAKVSEYTMMKEMMTYIEDQASFKTYMEAVNPADANFSETTRVYEGSNYTTLWKDLGGSFNPEEAHAILRNEIGASRPFELSAEERIGFTGLDSQSRQKLIDTAMENMQNTIETSSRFGEDANAVREALVRQSTLGGTSEEMSAVLVEALHPVSQLKGLAGGIAGFEEAKLIDKLSGGALGGIGVATVGGALGAVNTSLISSALAGTTEALSATALLPEIIAGAGGALAGYESSIAIAQALREAGANDETVKAVSSISGGAIGGGVTAAIGIGASVGAAALTGGEIGAFLAPETAGVSVAIGVGLGAVIGGASYVAGAAEDFGSALFDSITYKGVDPYYVMPNFDSMDINSTMEYLQKKDSMNAQQQQDQSQGITPTQRASMNAGTYTPPSTPSPTPAPAP